MTPPFFIAETGEPFFLLSAGLGLMFVKDGISKNIYDKI